MNETWCKCIAEPRGDDGLEGFVRNDTYRYVQLTAEDKKEYYRVYVTAFYYETCGPKTFKKYYKPL